MKADRKAIAAVVACILASPAVADEKAELLKLRNTTLNLIDLLVEQGILDKTKAKKMVEAAESKAEKEAAAERLKEEKEAAASSAGGGAPALAASSAGKGGKAAPPGTVRVTYVPEFVKEEIRNEVRAELTKDVVKEVKAQAKEEKWGIPAALPDWVNRFKLSGDMRLRGEGDFFGDDNQEFSYIDWPAVNKDGSFTRLGPNAYFNTTNDRERYRMRMRLALEAQIADNFKAGVRLATSNDRSPISVNQTLGQYGRQYELALDRAFVEYDHITEDKTNWFTVWGGRFGNPWLATDNMFDPDLSFEGLAGTFRLPIGERVALKHDYFRLGPQYRQINYGVTQPNSVFLTVGAFPLQEVQLSSHDKWFWGVQTGADWMFDDQSRLKAGVAYFDYRNTQAQPRQFNSDVDTDWTAPEFFTKGNTLMAIRNGANDPFGCANDICRVGLASNFKLLNFTATYDFARFDPIHLSLTAEYTKNLGFDEQQILQRAAPVGGLAGIVNYGDLKPRTNAFQIRFDVGYPEMKKLNDWGMFLAYKYLERDAVLDAFTDSNFHLAGTDAQGWIFGASYGLLTNTWLTARWMSASAIDGPPLDVDLLLVDLNARF